ncbi:TPA: antiviral RADAR system adenosine triphosphatase RdrA [Aeromonas hydrophila]
MSQNKRYIPLNAGESAVLPDANTLLPRAEVYEPLAQMIIDAVKKADAAKGRSLNEQREHNAISIDGARGTGKTAVLVNLKSYLAQDKHKNILNKVHILDPVDPTLLENGESLFLHIIVAAVLHDNEVKEAQRNEPNKARSLNQTLDKLAQSLESVETQQDRHGMDKVRAMYSNKQLADCVQDFFREVLGLLGKQLLILPIDDVDTSLNRAFENLEIVRRYLATPHVLPIVCGDRELYNEVTWRDFHGRLTNDSKHLSEAAYERAVELAAEYQRKILPFPRRLSMPKVSSYWQWGVVSEDAADMRVTLGNTSDAMPLANFISWLDIFLTGPVNGSEGSRPPLPIPSMRALSQLIRHCHDLIPELPTEIRTAKDELKVRMSWQIPPKLQDEAVKVAKLLDEAKNAATIQDEVENAAKLQNEAEKAAQLLDEAAKAAKQKRNEFAQKLANYFCFEPKAGAAYLVLLAKLHWQDWFESSSSRHRSLLDTPLFQPLAHATTNFELFDKADDLSAWPILLKGRLPEEWLAGIKSQKTMLPYPVAEVGVNSSKGWDYTKEIQNLAIQSLEVDHKNKASFLISLLAQNNFYTNAKQTMLLNIGRVFELLIASIVGPLSVENIYAIMGRAPFFSTAALVPTKTITINEKEIKVIHVVDESSEAPKNVERDINLIVEKLYQEIETWRQTCHVNQIELAPWLVYKVFNKVYSQVASNELVPNGMKDLGTALNMVAHVFYATWFAFGSFEKGELFNLPNVVATTNVNPENLKNYEQHDQFKVNVLPFTPTLNQMAKQDADYKNKTAFGQSSRVVSYILAEHPLKKWIDEVIKFDWPKDEPTPTPKSPKKYADKWLAEQLNIKTINATELVKAINMKELPECKKLWADMSSTFKRSSKAKAALHTALQTKFPGQF